MEAGDNPSRRRIRRKLRHKDLKVQSVPVPKSIKPDKGVLEESLRYQPPKHERESGTLSKKTIDTYESMIERLQDRVMALEKEAYAVFEQKEQLTRSYEYKVDELACRHEHLQNLNFHQQDTIFMLQKELEDKDRELERRDVRGKFKTCRSTQPIHVRDTDAEIEEGIQDIRRLCKEQDVSRRVSDSLTSRITTQPLQGSEKEAISLATKALFNDVMESIYGKVIPDVKQEVKVGDSECDKADVSVRGDTIISETEAPPQLQAVADEDSSEVAEVKGGTVANSEAEAPALIPVISSGSQVSEEPITDLSEEPLEEQAPEEPKCNLPDAPLKEETGNCDGAIVNQSSETEENVEALGGSGVDDPDTLDDGKTDEIKPHVSVEESKEQKCDIEEIENSSTAEDPEISENAGLVGEANVPDTMEKQKPDVPTETEPSVSVETSTELKSKEEETETLSGLEEPQPIAEDIKSLESKSDEHDTHIQPPEEISEKDNSNTESSGKGDCKPSESQPDPLTLKEGKEEGSTSEVALVSAAGNEPVNEKVSSGENKNEVEAHITSDASSEDTVSDNAQEVQLLPIDTVANVSSIGDLLPSDETLGRA